MTPTTPEIAPEPAPRPFAVPCRKLGFDAPLRWLRLGWNDFSRAPGLSLLFGGVILVVSGTRIELFGSPALDMLLTVVWVVGIMNGLDAMNGHTTKDMAAQYGANYY